MILEIVKYPDPVLRQKGKPAGSVTEKVKQLAEDMIETMRAANGVGLAAQQVGVPLQLTVLEVEATEERPSTMKMDGKEVPLSEWMPMILLDPALELGREKVDGSEGCLSFPEITADIERSMWVKARGRLLDGRQIEFEATGLLARALQHEVDHLNGILFIDRMKSATKTALKGRLKRLRREEEEA
ncbi:MAG: peptide deformylase [Chthoniobacteraceae bacterium]|jgi:peptide deformylase